MGLISPDYGTIFWMVLSFSLVFYLLAKFAWKPIMKGLKERESSIEEALLSAEAARKEMSELRADHEKVMQEARVERDALLGDARKMREEMLEEAKAESAKEGAKLVESARKQIENEKLSAIEDIRTLISKLSVEVAEKILRKEMADAKKSEALIDDMLKDMKLN